MTGEQKLGEGLADLPLGTKAPETREDFLNEKGATAWRSP